MERQTQTLRGTDKDKETERWREWKRKAENLQTNR